MDNPIINPVNNPPIELNILGLKYNIKIKDMMNEDGVNDAGNTINHTCVIKLDSANNKTFQKNVLLHEILEVLNYRLELKLEHEVITQLDAGLFSVLTDNPELLKYLLRD